MFSPLLSDHYFFACILSTVAVLMEVKTVAAAVDFRSGCTARTHFVAVAVDLCRGCAACVRPPAATVDARHGCAACVGDVHWRSLVVVVDVARVVVVESH